MLCLEGQPLPFGVGLAAGKILSVVSPSLPSWEISTIGKSHEFSHQELSVSFPR